MSQKLQILGFAGSLRHASYNRALLNTALELAPDILEIVIFDLASIPLYNQDIENRGDPEPVRIFKKAIAESDALLICTPEYNFSIPGVLKNALDWASRPAKTSVLRDKPVAVMGASTGAFGTARCQLALRSVFAFCNMHPLNFPQVLITHADEKFDKQGRLIDEETKGFVQDNLVAFVRWIQVLQLGKKAVEEQR